MALRTDPSVSLLFIHSIENVGKNSTFLSAAFYSSSRDAKRLWSGDKANINHHSDSNI